MFRYNVYYFATLVVLFVMLFSCHSHDHDHPDDHADDDHVGEEVEEVELTNEQMAKIGLEFGQFEAKNLKSTIKVNGQLELPPQNKANVSALVAGKVVRIFVKPGQYIQKGGRLASLQNPVYVEWQQAYLEAKGELKYLEKELQRQKELVGQEVAPQKQLDKVEAERDVVLARMKGVRTKLQMVGIRVPASIEADLQTTIVIKSPIAGFVRDIKINTGVFIQPEQDLFEIVDNHHLHLDLLVFEKDLPHIKVGQDIQFSLQSNPREVMEASIFSIGKAIDEEHRALTVHADMKQEKPLLLPGMYVEARIISEDRKVDVLPEEAITLDKGLSYIFVKEEEHEDATHFKKVAVLTGARDFGFVEVTPLDEIGPAMDIVTKGAFFLMAQTKKDEGGGGHHH